MLSVRLKRNYMSHLIHFNYHAHILYKYFEISIHIGKSKGQLLITISTKFLKCIIYTKLPWFYFIRWKLSFKYLSYMVKFGYFLTWISMEFSENVHFLFRCWPCIILLHGSIVAFTCRQGVAEKIATILTCSWKSSRIRRWA